jgi:hypothetical protein
MASTKYILKSKKAIEFYDNNKQFDFDIMNEFLVDILNKVGNYYNGNNITGNELKQLLNMINTKVNSIETNQHKLNEQILHVHEVQKITNDNLQTHKDYYVAHVTQAVQEAKNNGDIIQMMRETNQTLIDKTMLTLQSEYPRMNENMVNNFRGILTDEFCKYGNETNDKLINSLKTSDNLPELISQKYDTIQNGIQTTLINFMSKNQENLNDKLNEINKISTGFNDFLEKQKNSTLKGKESEMKLEQQLVELYPDGEIVNQSKEPKSCDYLLRRQNKPDILFENKDYANNVPNEEIKKFIRDIEYQSKHGIMLSQHSGINNKKNYQIDIHMGFIIVYVHNVNYDNSLIRNAVQLIEHLDPIIKKYEDVKGTTIPMETLSDINKEYLAFVSHKKNMIEGFKKFSREHLKQIEEIEMNKLTTMLNTMFTNVEQLSYKCDICNCFIAKNKRSLTTHQNKCKKIHLQNKQGKNVENNVEDLN